MKPSRDPNSTKYPDRTFHSGRWRTPEEIERVRGHKRAYELSREDQRQVRDRSPEYRAWHNQWMRERRARLLDSGLCVDCGRRALATRNSWRCNKCLDKKITPERLLINRRQKALARKAKRHSLEVSENG